MDNAVFDQTSTDEILLASPTEIEENQVEEKDIRKVQIEIGGKSIFVTNDPSIYHNDYDYDTNVLSDINLSVYMRLASIRAKSDKTIQFSNEKIQHSIWKSKVRTDVRDSLEKPTVKNIKEQMESLYSESLNRNTKMAIDFDMDFQNLRDLIWQFGRKIRHLIFVLQTNKYLYE